MLNRLMILALCCLPVAAQTLTIKLVNAKSGKPMEGQNITVVWVKDFKKSVVMVNDLGVAQVEVLPGAGQHYA